MTDTKPESPAARVLRVFGGAKQVADITGLSRVQVNRWNYPREKGGADGAVPAKHHEALLVAAKQRDIDLAPVDLMPWLAQSGLRQNPDTG